jgi:predicted CoA-binding protein
MTENDIREIFKSIRTIASVGLSSNPEKESYGVALYLKLVGYDIIPVNPREKQVLGEKAYSDLLSIPGRVDVVQIFRPSQYVPPVVDQAIQIGARIVWMQEGIRNAAAAKKAEDAGLVVIQDACMRSWHRHLFGEMPAHKV